MSIDSKNYKPNFSFAADLTDDLSHGQMAELLNYLTLELKSGRGTIKHWRKIKGLKVAELT